MHIYEEDILDIACEMRNKTSIYCNDEFRIC